MRRITSLAIALAVLLAVAAAAVMWWRSARTDPAPAAQEPRATAPAAASPASGLVLQVNRMPAATIDAGAPVFFTVTLTVPAPQPWTSRLRLETGDGKPLAPRIESLGVPFTVQLGGRPRADADAGAARDDVVEMHRAELGISPDEAARLPPGRHTIRAVLSADRGSDTRPLVSNTVTLTVAAPQAGAPTDAGSEKARLESAARFSLLSEKWEEAHRTALRLVERDDADASAYILLGDALNGLRRDGEALAAYHEALATLPRDLDESPDYLIARMEEVQQRLEAKARK